MRWLVTMEVRMLVSRYTIGGPTKEEAVANTVSTLSSQTNHHMGSQFTEVIVKSVEQDDYCLKDAPESTELTALEKKLAEIAG
jgi:phenylpyruvate tautomerase PptA (4-oxalocrotonate tautomerase family)